MAHIPVQQGVPGILSLFGFRPETAQPMNELAEVLLRGPSTLSRGEREMIASFVSHLNECKFCTSAHSAAAKHSLEGNADLVESVKSNYQTADVSPKLKSLLSIAGKVQKDGRTVQDSDVVAARKQGATDQEIHDTVLIAAAFCMYNRYVDGLKAWTPEDPKIYDQIGKRLADQGYAKP